MLTDFLGLWPYALGLGASVLFAVVVTIIEDVYFAEPRRRKFAEAAAAECKTALDQRDAAWAELNEAKLSLVASERMSAARLADCESALGQRNAALLATVTAVAEQTALRSELEGVKHSRAVSEKASEFHRGESAKAVAALAEAERVSAARLLGFRKAIVELDALGTSAADAKAFVNDVFQHAVAKAKP